MSACAPSHPGHDADPGPALDPGQQAEDAQLYRCVLHELIHIGTDFARILHLHATTQAQAALQGAAPSIPPEGLATAFDRTARVVRRCIALARGLHDPVPAPDHAARPRAARTSSREAGDATHHPSATPGRDEGAEAPSANQRDRPDARDRDAPDRDKDDTGRPITAVIADICRDLGLDAPPGAQPWTHGTPANRIAADIERPCAQAAAPSGAAASSARQPGPGPRAPRHGAAQRASGPADERVAQPSPVHPGCTLPDDPAEAAAIVLRHLPHALAEPVPAVSHHAQHQDQWRPPPDG